MAKYGRIIWFDPATSRGFMRPDGSGPDTLVRPGANVDTAFKGDQRVEYEIVISPETANLEVVIRPEAN